MSEQRNYADMSDAEKKKEDWMNSKWRPMMGWLYMGTCFFDFVVFPVLWSMLQASLGHPVSQWQPLTLQGAGLYHLAMGAVLGLAAWGRTQEKLNGANNGGLSPAGGFGAPSGGFGAPSGGFGSASSGGFGSGGGNFGSPAPMVPRSTTVTTTFGAPSAPVEMTASGKKIVPVMDEPEL